eukprot:CAMPEP_0197681280 /NCGR_PEP_ID=MMETSP1338-20131121/94666_1 /TAXON_ID=43686 ORGANISM="Pelagodinium beii, Strain RCC1491" /NCGR_SAMPLE_ID=MMETSP1338 /ASSEMBLY_ACC=CAM_ASM_000754 /LENGTH=84 /DNA_ID=CAMNT_0043262597 /DNA_START=465 /DNA_END=719 /DNA_ORIENTATION=-
MDDSPHATCQPCTQEVKNPIARNDNAWRHSKTTSLVKVQLWICEEKEDIIQPVHGRHKGKDHQCADKVHVILDATALFEKPNAA